ncbi:MAG: hypothetical protein IJO92_04900 [Clostridia bacterium]|nr:hypothetical protein [Clostridia bacterium]
MLSPQSIIKEFISEYKGLFLEEFTDFYNINRFLERKKDAVTVCSLCDAYEERLQVWLIFCFGNGLKENLNHFKCPMNPNVNESEPDLYLRESAVRQLPAFRAATEKIAERVKNVSKMEYDAILEYYTYLETLLPKIAHLKGFEFGDQILPMVEPGYVPDLLYTKAYRKKVSLWSELKF